LNEKESYELLMETSMPFIPQKGNEFKFYLEEDYHYATVEGVCYSINNTGDFVGVIVYLGSF
jgi:hypothetical protein